MLGSDDTLYSVDAPHFNCGFVARKGRVIRAAPIINWVVGKTVREVSQYFFRKRYHVVKVVEDKGQ